jgi:hypothetical protein
MKSELQLLLFTSADSIFIRIFCQHNRARVSTCPLTIHALLHIADYIEAVGPVWGSWGFPMERICQWVMRGIHNRQHPWANIDKRLITCAHLNQVKLRFHLSEVLNLGLRRTLESRGIRINGCMYSNLHSLSLPYIASFCQMIIVSFSHYLAEHSMSQVKCRGTCVDFLPQYSILHSMQPKTCFQSEWKCLVPCFDWEEEI